MPAQPRHIELLAPARDAQVALDAINHGADAVYMGPAHHGARAAAGNSLDDIARVCDHAHRYCARVYATVNTLVMDSELRDVERLVHGLYRAGVDALIVQDMALLRLDLPPIALHASTQCDLRTPSKARFLEAVGFSQLVMARELTLDEIAAIRAVTTVPLEAFVHGALCVSYSGRCALSQVCKGRSANRGACAQMCRLPYDLVDDSGRRIVTGKHLLSLRDLNLSDRLEPLLEAGVSSLKIEGRLKDSSYVKNVVAYYRQALDAIIAAHPDRYARASLGHSDYTFTPCLERSFNRSFTHYFLDERRPADGTPMAQLDTPKSMGQPVGRVATASHRVLTLDRPHDIVNGDGLSFMSPDGTFTGVRVNRVEGTRLILRDEVAIAPGTTVYRTADKAFDDLLARPSATRTIALDATLAVAGNRLMLTLEDERGNRVTHSIDAPDLQPARTSQAERQQQTLARLGDTIYRLRNASVLPECFIPASMLTALRRETLELLDRAQRLTLDRPRRLPEDRTIAYPATTLTPADNVANHLAEQFYRDHGVTTIAPALETHTPASDVPSGTILMHTRYCIRRQLGACLRGPHADRLPAHLYLVTGNTRLALHFDCPHCETHITL